MIYPITTMSKHVTPIDISNIPDLVRIVEDMKKAQEPRILKQGSAPVAMLVPMESATQRHQTIEPFGFQPLDNVKASLLDAGDPQAEVNDMIAAMSELPEYAGRGVQKSQYTDSETQTDETICQAKGLISGQSLPSIPRF
jgi:hypothetical protein